ncbi:F-box/kelch-repeat protein At1g55270-like [Impatiens glandulifera]|uniref:F-box/kelch-repeat protein At1g55270-like n=1 Tax=Impatiens glandulifera TaxID=253017 RepID=UPI001FB0EC77|nr:F-box/kelch-repeat protein At1g55270-like [Impatiens glandulifera]
MKRRIDGLPECLILECLARLHLKDLPAASRVCRRWLHLIKSRHFYSLRKQLGCTNQVACLLQHMPPTNSLNIKYVINMFDPMDREWNRLPPIPDLTKEHTWQTWIASSEGKLVVFCGSDTLPMESVIVFVLDFATQRWRKGKDMPLVSSSRFSTVSSPQCQRIFISGDHRQKVDAPWDYVWEYDVLKEEWTVLYQIRSFKIRGLRIIGEELWVIIGHKHIGKWTMPEGHGAVVYHLRTNKWREVTLTLGRVNNLLSSRHNSDLKLYKLMKKLYRNEFDVMKNCCSRLQLGKQSLLMTTCGNNGGKELFCMQDQEGKFDKMEPPSIEFSGYVESSYCIEL